MKKPRGRGPRGPRNQRGGPGGGRKQANRGPRTDYFVQPGKRGTFVVLRKPAGNRITPKVCGVMPSRVHAKMLVTQLEKAESVVSDLFLEATDDGIEALEAVLEACRTEVLRKGPAAPANAPRDGDGGGDAGGGQDDMDDPDAEGDAGE